MKPRNEVKAKLFAMHWGQKVWSESIDREPIELNYITDGGILHLRPIESLTDEELSTFLYLDGYSYKGNAREMFEPNITSHNIVVVTWDDSEQQTSNIQAIDYLRSIRIALPFTYLDENQQPQTASVTDQESWGFIKLVEK